MCTRPLKGFRVGITEKGKPLYKICSRDVTFCMRQGNFWISSSGKLPRREILEDPYLSKNIVTDYIDIPCGKCVQCRLAYSRQWADRLMIEAMDYSEFQMQFLTLTYDDEHIWKTVNYDTGEVGSFPGTLMKSHYQGFMKRLRQYLVDHQDDEKKILDGDKLRFFACGEYGTKTFRPHYHAIIYGLTVNDKEFWKNSRAGFPLFRSEKLEDLWKNGIVTVSPVSWDCCAYTARYVLKKAKDLYDKDLYEQNDLTPEFVLMSRKPGIGKNYFDKHWKEIYERDVINLPEGRKAKPSKYFDSLYETLDPDDYAYKKQQRKEIAEWNEYYKLRNTDKSKEEYLKTEEKIYERKAKKLTRLEI